MVRRSGTSTVRQDGTIQLPYWAFKKGGVLHKRRGVVWHLREDGTAMLEPVEIVWLKAPKKPYQVIIHAGAEGEAFWAEVPRLPGLKVVGASIREVKERVREAIPVKGTPANAG